MVIATRLRRQSGASLGINSVAWIALTSGIFVYAVMYEMRAASTLNFSSNNLQIRNPLNGPISFWVPPNPLLYRSFLVDSIFTDL